MSSAVPPLSNHSSSAGASSSSSTTASNISLRPTPSPPMTPGRQQTPPPSLQQQPSAAPSLVVRGRNRELQQLNNEIQLLEEELKLLDSIPPASKACRDLVTFVENHADPFFPNRGLMIDLPKPHAVVGSFNDMLTSSASLSDSVEIGLQIKDRSRLEEHFPEQFKHRNLESFTLGILSAAQWWIEELRPTFVHALIGV